MFHVLKSKLAGCMPEYRMVGWTDNEYIASSFLQAEYGADLVDDWSTVQSYDCDYKQFLEILEEDYDVDITEINRYKLRIMETKSGHSVITTKDEFDSIMTDSTVIFDAISDVLKSIMILSILKKYIKEEQILIFLDFYEKKYLYEMIYLLYREGDAYNSKFDVLYLLLTEGFIYKL